MSTIVDVISVVTPAIGMVVMGIEVWLHWESQRRTNTRPSLMDLTRFADLFGLNLRKRLKALAGDYDAEIRRLHKQHRYKMARWNKLLAWGYAFWYVFRAPIDWLVNWAVKAVKGQ